MDHDHWKFVKASLERRIALRETGQLISLIGDPLREDESGQPLALAIDSLAAVERLLKRRAA